jgi:RNA polymerase sigma-70 factor (ECF subfamily)
MTGELGLVISDALRRKLLRWCRSFTRCWFLAEDAVQEVELALLETKSPPAIEKLVAWCYRVARYKSVDILRRRERETPEDPAGLESVENGVEPTEPLLPEDAERRKYRACLDAMSDDLRIAWILRVEHGRSYEDMATILDVKRQTLHTRVCRARKHLRKWMGNGFDNPASNEDKKS